MVRILVWVIYGLIVGLIAKAVMRYKDSPKGLFSTLAIGVCGSFVGGFVNHLVYGSGDPLQPSGILMGVVGGMLTCFAYRKLVTEKIKRELAAKSS
jgi:uncharacterized membrane protein YeaQ/YmgE (transglycosylase-associated protein family)